MKTSLNALVLNHYESKKHNRFVVEIKDNATDEIVVPLFLVKEFELFFSKQKNVMINLLLYETVLGSPMATLFKMWKLNKMCDVEIKFLDSLGKVQSTWKFDQSEITSLEVTKFDYSSALDARSKLQFTCGTFLESKELERTGESNGI
jgi:hypothetical protein